jgi:MFS family permease
MYAYYATVYSTIQDIIEPALRGTAMALYFFAMYVLGASFGPLATGWMSDHFARRAAAGAGVALGAGPVPEQFRAIGLHQAMHIVPALGVVLAAVLCAAAVTVRADIRRLEVWMRSAERGPAAP